MQIIRLLLLITILVALAACEAGSTPSVPTERPTESPTFTGTPSRTPGAGASTATPTSVRLSPTGGPSPTSLFGATRTPAPNQATPTRVLDPNAPRIEFFTADVLAIEPGGTITLYWSARNVQNVVIYRLDGRGERSVVWNVGPDGSQQVNTRSTDRGQVDFVLIAGEGEQEVQQTLLIPLACPIAWFFTPAPDTCPDADPLQTQFIEQPFERGRMIYLTEDNTVYTLFNDGSAPAWIPFENRYDPTIHPEADESFPNPPGLFQPIAVLGFVWRGNDTVRNRLGLGTLEETVFDGIVQTVTLDGEESLYLSSADGSVIQILPDGESWQIITAQ